MSEAMFQASLQEGRDDRTRSYNIVNLFYVALFGGIVPTLILSLKNARWLKTSDRVLKMIVIACISAILIKITIVTLWLLYSNTIPESYLLVDVGLAIVYYLVVCYLLKDKYHQHKVIVGEIEPLLKSAIIWIPLGRMIEMLIFSLWGGVLSSGFILQLSTH